MSGHFLRNLKQLPLTETLLSGQSLRWIKEGASFVGVIGNHVVRLSQSMTQINYEVLHSKCSAEDMKTVRNDIYEYLQLGKNMQYIHRDVYRREVPVVLLSPDAKPFQILRLDPAEALVMQLLGTHLSGRNVAHLLRQIVDEFGEPLSDLPPYVKMKRFPRFEDLATPTAHEYMRHINMGYCAGFVHRAAAFAVAQGGNEWFDELRNKKALKRARISIRQMPGVGVKTADILCLTSLGHDDCVPITSRKGMVVDRPSEYRRMSREYTILAGRYAGWAYAWAQRHRMPYAPVLFMSEKAAHEANSVAATQSQPDH